MDFSSIGANPFSSYERQGSDESVRKAQGDQAIDPGFNNSSILQSVQSADQIKQLQLQGEKIGISEEQLIKAIEKAVKAVQGPATQLEFSFHKPTKQIMVKVLEKDTGKLIREVPPEKTLDFIASIWKQAGIFVDEKR
ncbi:flagellar protein FlaG [Paenibacillus allorhizosphaerae]|uniref:Flagellar protein FlaG n=1 Tax=Paenibacillus allorhizosphaerae TaxID=2849866 RepID=A0ABM8VS93_9BACL|nr:flagellar protein FlaG [Paenibacillus allorhizosphaerae]CAG7656163.1 hypothetical protein PAECIP111802_06320 [Paenibacillus allorhizosphaerae]